MSSKLKMHCIVMRVPGGSNIAEICREAIITSMEYQCNVQFEFNGKTYNALYEPIFDLLAEQHEEE